MRYVGFCGPKVSRPTEWGDGDRVGHLLAEFPDGWRIVGSHYSSSEAFARMDIGAKFSQRENPVDSDTYEWIGAQEDSEALLVQYPPAPAVAALSEEERP